MVPAGISISYVLEQEIPLNLTGLFEKLETAVSARRFAWLPASIPSPGKP